VGSVGIEAVGEGADEGQELVDAAREVEGGVEPVAPGRLRMLDAAGEVEPFGRQPSTSSAFENRLIGRDQPQWARS